MRMGILSQWFDPEPGPASLPGVYAREFIRQGHTTRVLTGFPNYPDGVLHPGYRVRRVQQESSGSVDVTRVALYPNHSSSAIGRVLNYTSFAASATAFGRAALAEVDAVWVYNSPVTVSLPLLAHTRMGRTPFFLHVQDLWPDSLINSGMFPTGWAGKPASAAINKIVRLTERKAATVGVISPGVREIILARHPDLDPSKIIYAPNPTDEHLYQPAEQVRRERGIEIGSSDVFELMYAGAIGEVQGLDTLIDAAQMIHNYDHIRIVMVGDGISRERLEARVADLGLRNVRFAGRVGQQEIPELIARSQAQLVSLADHPFLAATTPSKIGALLASGVPIIGQLAGDGAQLIRESGAGCVVRPGDAEGLAESIVTLADRGPEAWQQLGRRGRAYYENELSVETMTARILDTLSESVRSSSN